ncbi:hypothetical protein NJ75_04428 [Novosphingobium subterraneum]|jgi:hypothetical protein|uniref:Uncharacterized protein n=1 Tax=Novosphingobium subterraneum TaxID=48936 RepID=A0A0B8ZY42_9SPHN|nr:hypothetical protein NJ75_04428 [Novosphingobium subterraneum]
MGKSEGRNEGLSRALELLEESLQILDAHQMVEAALRVSLAIDVLKRMQGCGELGDR